MSFLIDDKRIEVKDYLLGTLSDDEKARLEEEYFNDDELFEQVEIAEDELVDAYIHGRLTTAEVAHFESKLAASSRLTERVAFAKTLAKSVAADRDKIPVERTVTAAKPVSFWHKIFLPASPQSPLRWVPVASLVLLTLAGAFLLFETIRMRQESRRLAMERAELDQRHQALAQELNKRNSELTSQLEQARSENERLLNNIENLRKDTTQQTGGSELVVAFLSPGTLRSSGKSNSVVVSSQTKDVRLYLRLTTPDYSTYRATIKTVEGDEKWSRDELKAQSRSGGKVIQITIPAARLSKSFYSIELSGRTADQGLERASTYQFRVEHK